MKRIIMVLCVVTSLAVTAQDPDKKPSLEEMIGLSIKAFQETNKVTEERRDALGNRPGKSDALANIIRLLKRKKAPTEDLESLDKKIADTEKRLDDMKKRPGSSTNYLAGQLMEYQLKKKVLEAKDDAAKDALMKELEAQRSTLKAEIKTLSQPFNERSSAISQKVDVHGKAMKKALKAFILTPDKKFPGCQIQFNVTPGNAFASAIWSKKDDKQIAWAHFRIRPPEESKNASMEKLDGKYPVSTLSDTSIWLWAGPMYIAFISSDKDLKGKEIIKRLVKDLIDLEGLSKIVPAK